MKYVFFGSDDFSVKTINQLNIRGYKPDLIITIPDKKQGRKMVLTPPPLKIWAEKYNIPTIQTANLDGIEIGNDWDLFIISSYGLIIKNNILNIPKKGCLNIHPSLLPKYRGATPIQSAILSDDQTTGVSIMLMDEKMDHGPVIIQKETEIKDKNYLELRDELALTGANLLADILPDWLLGKIKATPQNHNQATFTKKIVKEDGLINLEANPILNFKKIRAYNPWPGTFFFFDHQGKTKRFIIKQAHLENEKLIIDTVIPEGKKETNWQNFIS